MIRDFINKDILDIEILGKKLHNNYKFSLDTFSKCKVLEINNSIIGFITYSIIYDRAEIIDIIIKEEFRNKGYAKKLIEEVIVELKNNQCKNITLEVNEKNPAVKFYKKIGFEIVSIRKGYYNGQDGYLMEKKLEVK